MNVRWEHSARGREAAGTLAPEFPQALDFHDTAVALGHLNAALADGVPFDACRLLNVHYVPRRALWAVYELGGARGATALATVRFLPGTSAERFAAAAAAARDRAAVAHLADWDAVAWLFPEDDTRPEMAALADAAAVTALLHPAAAPGGARWRVLAYRPGGRCAVRYDWPAAAPVVGKLEAGAARRHALLCALWTLRGRRFAMPEPLACDPGVDARFERFVDGERIEDLDMAPGAALEVVAGALVALHGTPPPGAGELPRQTAAEVLRRLERRVLPRVEAALGRAGGAWARFGAAVRESAAELPAPRLRMVHGDLQTGNVLLAPDGPTFIDLDSLALGDPAFDLALLGSRLLFVTLYARGDVAAAAAAVAELPQRYAAAGGDPVPAQAFAWFMGALLVGRQVKTCVQHLAPGAPELAGALLETAQRTLARRRFDASCVAVG